MTGPFTCPHCGQVSHNPNDAREGYCGACHWWTGVPELYEPWKAEHPPRVRVVKDRARPR